MKSTVAILLLVAAGTSARSLRSETEYPEIKPFDNANSKKFCNYACSSKFYGGEMGWFEVSPIKYAYPGLVAETKKAADVFYKTQKDPVKAYDQVQKIEAEMQRLFDQFNKRYREATR